MRKSVSYIRLKLSKIIIDHFSISRGIPVRYLFFLHWHWNLVHTDCKRYIPSKQTKWENQHKLLIFNYTFSLIINGMGIKTFLRKLWDDVKCSKGLLHKMLVCIIHLEELLSESFIYLPWILMRKCILNKVEHIFQSLLNDIKQFVKHWSWK